jgi:AraC-like DNA-binding protein
MLAAEFGYFDQSHMNAEFRAAFGASPGRYRRDFH